jgi:hypothetical protein
MEMNTEQAHYYCGHNSLRATRATVKYLGWKLTRTPFNQCEACDVGKTKQSNLGDGESHPPKSIGELWGINGMKLKWPIREAVHFPSNNCMNIAVDHSTGAAFIGWYPTKKGFIHSFYSKLYQ